MSTSESHSSVVLELAEEFLERYRQGQRPSLKEYIDRHPDLAAEIKEVFPAMALMENVALADESLGGAATGPATPTEATPPRELGDYRILREVGRGGMGIVYEAEQVSLGRHVALKVLPRQVFVDDSQRRRFEREARAAAKLHHTNIVPVFGVGDHNGMPYYVMQFIQGLGLDGVLDELKRMQASDPATATGGELRVARKDVSAADVARSLMTGAFQEPKGSAEAPVSEASVSTTGKLSDSFALSSSVKLPGSNEAAHGRSKKATYWQSVAQIGVQVAEALEYAHKQGIQHRDIKPSNLLLDTHGTVWVTDFGLARADNEDHLTQTGDIVGTLRYMPPEAYEGLTDKRGDIYSLGLTLYEMLAMKPAYEERDRHRLIKLVTTSEPPRLDKLNRSIPRDLATIVHKAIDREPGRRYPSAAELAADLQRFLDDEPIQARRISTVERSARWCRHYPGVASLTGILILLLVGVTVVSLLAAAHFDRLASNERQARAAAEQAMDHEATLREQAEESKRQADQQKQEAESNFAKARKAVDDYFTAVSESQLLKVPGMQPLRRELLQSALMFYLDFLKKRSEDPALRGELAATYLRVGEIRSELEEGAEARKSYEQAQALYETLTKEAPESVEWRHGLALCYFRNGRTDESIALWERLVQPEQPDFQKDLAEAYNIRALTLTNAGRQEEGLKAHQRALSIRETLVRLYPGDAAAQRDLGGTLNNIGVLLAQKRRPAEALTMYRRAAERAETAFAQAPQVISNGRFLSIQLHNVAHIENQLGHKEECLAALRQVAEVWRRLARDNPAVPSLHSSLFSNYRTLALYQRALEKTEEAERTMRLARAVIDRLPSDGPEALFNLACVRAECAAFLGQGKDKSTAEEQAEQKQEAILAMEALRKAVAAGFRDEDRLRKAAELNSLRSRLDFKALEAFLAVRAAAAPSDKQKGNEQGSAQGKRAEADRNDKRLRADRAASQHAIALLLLDLGKLDEAHKHLQEAIELREALVKDEPKNERTQTELAVSRFALGDFYWRTGRLADAAKAWQQELDAVEAAARQTRDRSALAGQLLDMRRTVTQHYVRAGLWSEAAAHFGQLLHLKGASYDDYYAPACTELRAGDIVTYRRTCEVMTEKMSEAEFHQLCDLGWACGLVDSAGTEFSQTIKLILKKARLHPPNEYWECHVLGLVHYRAGQLAEAIASAKKSMALNPTWHGSISNWPVLAMAHHGLGQVDDAKLWLEKCKQEWRRLSPLPRSANSTTALPSMSSPWYENWQDWLTFEILFREASLTITGSLPVEEAYDLAHRSLLHSRLGEADKAETEWQAARKILPHEPMIWLSRAHQFVEQKRAKDAEELLVKIEAFQSNDPNVWKECGRLRFGLSQTAQATADFRKAVELLGDKVEPSVTATSESDKLFARLADKAVLERLAAAVERHPEDTSRLGQRAEWYARHRRWKEAAADFLNALPRNPPNDTYPWLHAAPAVVAAGDREGYRRLCREMRERFGDSENPMTADRLAKVHLLLAVEDMEWAGLMADRAASLGKNNEYAVYFIFCKALADYRRGDIRAVLEVRNQLLPPPERRLDLIAAYHPILAMAYYRQGDAQAARNHLAEADKIFDQYLPDPDRFPTYEDSSYQHDWLIAWLLYREAQALIEAGEAEKKN